MKRALSILAGTLILGFPAASAHEHGGEMSPEQAEQHAACVADITEKSAAAGMPVKNADTACQCLGQGVTKNPALMDEIEAAGGLPPRDVASADLQAVVEACMAADQAA